MRKTIFILLLVLLSLALLVLGVLYCHKHRAADTAEEMESVQVEMPAEETHGMIKFVDIEFDDRMLGKWQNVQHPTWFRVYTTEPADEGFCWGREWDTADDIFEEDLTPYGNGWFMWKKEGDNVIELHMTDNRGATIPFEYKMLNLNEQQMNYKEKQDAERHQFRKIDYTKTTASRGRFCF